MDMPDWDWREVREDADENEETMVTLATLLTTLPAAMSIIKTAGDMIAAGRTTGTAEEAANLQAAFQTLASASAAFNTQFADVLPKP